MGRANACGTFLSGAAIRAARLRQGPAGIRKGKGEMNAWFKRIIAPSQTGEAAAYRFGWLARLVAVGSAANAVAYLFFWGQTGAWQLLPLFGLGMAAAIVAGWSARTASQGQLSLAAGVLITTCAIIIIPGALVLAGTGLALGLIVFVLNLAIAAVALPARQLPRVAALTGLAGLLAGVIELTGAQSQIQVPGLPTGIQLIALLTGLAAIGLVVWQMPAYPLPNKLFVAFLLTGLIPLALAAYFGDRLLMIAAGRLDAVIWARALAVVPHLLLWLALFLAAAALLAALSMARRLSAPLVRLTQVAEQVAAGDLTARAPVGAMDEIGILAAAFNRITAQVRELIAELESRVAARTAELTAANLALQAEIHERAQVERALRESQAQYQRILETADEGIWTSDADERITLVNRKLTELLGYLPAELLGRAITDLMDDEGRAIAARNIERRRETAEARQTYKLQTKDGRAVWVEIESKTMLNQNGHFQGTLVMAVDITERHLVETALGEERERLRLALDAARMGIWDFNPASGQVCWSAEVAALFGLAPERFDGTAAGYLALIHPEDRPRVEAAIARALAEPGLDYWVEHRVNWSDGSVHWLEGRGQVHRDATGQPTRMAGTVVDITHRKRAETALQESEAKYRALVEHASDGIFIIDRDGRVSDVNASGLALTGHTSAELIGRGVHELMVAEEAGMAIWPTAELETGRVVVIERQLVHQTGHVLPVEVSAKGMPDGKYLAIMRDITERRQAEAAQERLVAILEATPDFVGTADATGRMLYLNRAGRRLAGLSEAADVTLTHLAEYHPKWTHGVLQEAIGHALRQGMWAGESALLTDAGREIPVSQFVIAHQTPAGDVQFISTILHDISERKETEAALRRAEAKYRDIVENTFEGIFQCTPEGRYLSLNPAMAQMHGYNLPEGMLAAVTDLTQQVVVDLEAWGALRRRLEKEGEVQKFEVRHRRQDGEILWASYNVRAVHDRDSGQMYYEGTVTDITERKQAEVLLKASEERNRLLVTAIPDLLFRLDGRGLFLDYKAEDTHLLLLPPEGFLGRHYTQVLPPELSHLMAEAILAARLSGQVQTFEYTLPGAPQDEHVYEARLVAMNDGQTVIISREITERKRAEAALRSANDRLVVGLAELERRNLEATRLKELGEMLQSCLNLTEAYQVLSNLMPRLFSGRAGAVGIVNADHNWVESVAAWGGPALGEPVFGRDDCWALRRGRAHERHASETVACPHLGEASQAPSVCVPMAAQGEALGILTLLGQPECALGEGELRLAQTVADSVALALANLRLRETLRHQSIRDSLTGLFNRRYMEESLDREVLRAARQRSTVGILMLDLDHFKQYNDSHGHGAGDALLRAVGQFLQVRCRREDIPCRYGGEEFILILPGAPLEIILERAERLRQEIKHLAVEFGGQTFEAVTLSVGVALWPTHGAVGQEVLHAVDAALYQAKREGRDRVVVAELNAAPAGAL